LTDVAVKFDSGSDTVTIVLRGAVVVEPRFRLRDTATEKFLTKRGWGKSPAFLPGDAETEGDLTVLVLDGDLARRITAGMNLSLEQPASNVFVTLHWPTATADAQADPVPESADKPEAEDGTLTSGSAIHETADAQADAAPESADEPEAEDEAPTLPGPAIRDAADAQVDSSPEKAHALKAEDDAPSSLEPAIREEAVQPVHARDAIAGKAESTDEEDEDDASGHSWGLVAAAAVLFLVLGSVLTYFWQSSAYESDLRTAMRALESQRDQEKAAFDKRLAEALANQDNAATDTISTANTQIASLTDQTAELTKDRDTARLALADQRNAVKDLEQRLATANGEIETLKAAQEADATEQSAVFNDRIGVLTAELDKARKELAKAGSDLLQKDELLVKSESDLKAANAKVAALKAAAGEEQDTRNEALDTKIKSLGAELDKASQDLADRDKALRDVQAKLSVANVQIEALKQVAGKATESDLERSTLADQITDLTTKLDKADKDLAAKEQDLSAKEKELAKVKTSLDAANALLSSNAEEIKRLADAKTPGPAVNPEPGEQPAGLQQERDLYARELATMTDSFTALKAEKDKLAETVKTLEDQVASVGASTSTSGTRAVWGATAIDRSGAIYSLQNQIAEKSATDNVLALCRGKSRTGCETLKTYSNSCFSVARIEGEGPRNDNFGFSVSKNWKSAEAAAVRQCEELGAGCTVRFTACSPDVLSKPALNQ
jgi:predicted  nucleic acid-binding Zn-ribbon protein